MTDPKKCQHYWSYVHIVFSGPREGSLIRRWCIHCDTEQVGRVTKWREPRINEFDRPAKEWADD